MSNTDSSIGKNERGEKLYHVEGFTHPQVLSGCSNPQMRIVKRPDGYTLQFSHYRKGNGEFTEHQWVDVSVVGDSGKLIGYEFK